MRWVWVSLGGFVAFVCLVQVLANVLDDEPDWDCAHTVVGYGDPGEDSVGLPTPQQAVAPYRVAHSRLVRDREPGQPSGHYLQVVGDRVVGSVDVIRAPAGGWMVNHVVTCSD